MPDLSVKELKVLQVLADNSDRPQKQLAVLAGLSEAEFSRTKKELFSKGVIKKFTIDIDYRQVGYPNLGVLFVSIVEKKAIRETAAAIMELSEAIAVFEVFGQAYDLVIKCMSKDNPHLREVTRKITEMENVRAGPNTFTIIYADVFKDERGVPIDYVLRDRQRAQT
jgi:DNA-binding Lrp family transcriptional regulator